MKEKHYYLVYIINEENEDTNERFENSVIAKSYEKACKIANKWFKDLKEQYEIGVSEIFEKEVYITQWRPKNESN